MPVVYILAVWLAAVILICVFVAGAAIGDAATRVRFSRRGLHGAESARTRVLTH